MNKKGENEQYKKSKRAGHGDVSARGNTARMATVMRGIKRMGNISKLGGEDVV
jgi:hypothetical protein